MNNFITYYNNLIDDNEKKEKTINNVNLIEKALDTLDNDFANKTKIKSTSLSLICYGMYKIIKDKKSSKKYLQWVHNFLDNYDKNEDYLVYCGSGTASSEAVKGRLSYFSNAIKKM